MDLIILWMEEIKLFKMFCCSSRFWISNKIEITLEEEIRFKWKGVIRMKIGADKLMGQKIKYVNKFKWKINYGERKINLGILKNVKEKGKKEEKSELK